MYKANTNPKINKKKTGRKLFKRLLPIFMIIPLLMCTTFQMPQNAEAAIVSKVITKVAKKMIKEVTKDSAVNQASKIILEYQMESMIKEAYKVPDGYEAVCFEHATAKCNKPALVKKNLTSNDKKVIGSKIDDILDSKAGMTPFKKFVDWLVPLWAIGLTVSVLQYSTDPDFKKFMDDIAMEALYAMGFIIPITPKDAPEGYKPIEDIPFDFETENDFITQNEVSLSTGNSINLTINQQFATDDVLSTRFTNNGETTTYGQTTYSFHYDGNLMFYKSTGYNPMQIDRTKYSNFILEIYDLDRNLLHTAKMNTSNNNVSIPSTYNSLLGQNVKITNVRQVDESHYQIVMMGTYIWSFNYYNPTFSLNDNAPKTFNIGSQLSGGQKFHYSINNDTSLATVIPLPTTDEIIDYSSPLETTPYKQGSTVYFPSPKTIEYTTPDEKKITPSPTTPGEFIDEEGNVVPEDDVIVSDPKVEPTPDGDIVYTPEPTPENPNPTPEPITPPNETELGHKLPFEFVLALLKVLKATLNFMKVQFLFFATLPFIPEKEIPFEMFQAFKDFKPFNFPIYATVQGFAAFTSTFLIFRVIRRMF